MPATRGTRVPSGAVEDDPPLHARRREPEVGQAPLPHLAASLYLRTAAQNALFRDQFDHLIGPGGWRFLVGPLDELRYLLVGADEDALSLVVEVGAVADPLQVFQSERRAAVGHEPAMAPCDIVRTHHRGPGRTGNFRFAACGHRQRDEIADLLQ